MLPNNCFLIITESTALKLGSLRQKLVLYKTSKIVGQLFENMGTKWTKVPIFVQCYNEPH